MARPARRYVKLSDDPESSARKEARMLDREVRRAPPGTNWNRQQRRVIESAREMLATDRLRKTDRRRKKQTKKSRRQNRG